MRGGIATRGKIAGGGGAPVVALRSERELNPRREEKRRYRRVRGLLLAPIRAALAFSMLTYLLFVFGVWDFPGRRSLQLAAWVLMFNVAMFAGFRAGVRKSHRIPARSSPRAAVCVLENLLSAAFWVTLITFLPRLVIETQLYDLEVGSLISRVQVGLNDALGVYQRRASLVQPPGLWVYVNYLCVATGFITWLYTPLAILFWHRLSATRRLLTVMFWASTVVSATARGQNFGVFDLGIRIVVFFLVQRYFVVREALEPNHDVTPSSSSKRRRFRTGHAAAAVALGAAMIGFFANTMRSRVGDRFDRLLAIGGQYVAIDQQSLIWMFCPDGLKPICATLLAYVTHGYVGLGLSLRMPFDSTLGLGNSLFLIDNAKQMFGIDLLSLTYQDKVFDLYGYHYSILWHTAYSWIANDVSFWGVPIVLFCIFHIFGSAWSDFVLTRNILGVLFLAPMATMIIFISANNQLMSNPNSLAAMIVLTLYWSATRNRYDWAAAFALLMGRTVSNR